MPPTSSDKIPLADIPTLNHLYNTSALKPSPESNTTSCRKQFIPSASLNDRTSLIRADITKLQVDAIVNAANKRLLGGGGVDGSIHRSAGPSLLAACRLLGGCPVGEARITEGFKLPAKHVIHTVGPFYTGNHDESSQLLRSCYIQSLELAVANGIKTIAFCGISTGIYGYPAKLASRVACETVREFLESPPGQAIERVVFVTFIQQDVDAYDMAVPTCFPPDQDAVQKQS